MENNDTQSDARVWRYVHGEMAQAEEAEFARELQRDSSLAGEHAAARRLDSLLRELMPATALTDEALAARILDEIERDAEAPAPLPFPTRTARPRRSLTAYWPGLATLAAAALLLVLVLPPSSQPPFHWEPARFEVAQYRGETSPEPVYDAEDAERCRLALRKAVEDGRKEATHKASADAAKRDMPSRTFTFLFRELADGTAGIVVKLYNDDGEVAEQWTEYCEGHREFEATMTRMAARIVADLFEDCE